MGRKKGNELSTFYVSVKTDLKERFENYIDSRGLVKNFIMNRLFEMYLNNPDILFSDFKETDSVRK